MATLDAVDLIRIFVSARAILEGLLVELWPRVAAMEHPNCAFGLLVTPEKPKCALCVEFSNSTRRPKEEVM